LSHNTKIKIEAILVLTALAINIGSHENLTINIIPLYITEVGNITTTAVIGEIKVIHAIKQMRGVISLEDASAVITDALYHIINLAIKNLGR
jgi:hypothetical protein